MRGLPAWLFYGHLWIAMAAAGLSWQSTYLATGEPDLVSTHVLVFFATFGVYTLHRSLSYHRAGSEPDSARYRLVAHYPKLSHALGAASLSIALVLASRLTFVRWLPVILALPFTFFYLIPIFPGGPRLRDLPYLKVVWVALAWTLMTDVFVTGSVGAETIVRFAFTLAVALLFDTRDVELDRRQGVRTLAADHPYTNRRLAFVLLIGCALVSYFAHAPFLAYLLAVNYVVAGGLIVMYTKAERGENYYAIYVNGLLVLPPLGCLLASWLPG